MSAPAGREPNPWLDDPVVVALIAATTEPVAAGALRGDRLLAVWRILAKLSASYLQAGQERTGLAIQEFAQALVMLDGDLRAELAAEWVRRTEPAGA